MKENPSKDEIKSIIKSEIKPDDYKIKEDEINGEISPKNYKTKNITKNIKHIKHDKSIEPYDRFVDNVSRDLIEQKELRDKEPKEEEYIETPTEIIKTKKSIEPYNKFVDNVSRDLIEQKELRDKEPKEEEYMETPTIY